MDGTNDLGESMTNNIYSYKLEIEDFEDTKELFMNMSDPEHIKSLDCIPIAVSNADGRIELEYKYLPIGKEVLRLDASGNELGVFSVPSSLYLVFIKDNFQPKSLPVTINFEKPLDLSVVLEAG